MGLKPTRLQLLGELERFSATGMVLKILMRQKMFPAEKRQNYLIVQELILKVA